MKQGIDDLEPVTRAEIVAYQEKLAEAYCKKVRFRSQAAARRVLKQCKMRGRDERNAYRCLMCMGWHLTSATIQVSQGI